MSRCGESCVDDVSNLYYVCVWMCVLSVNVDGVMVDVVGIECLVDVLFDDWKVNVEVL